MRGNHCFVVPGFPGHLVFYQPFQEIALVIRILHDGQR
jgi:hypothetical protein